MQSSFVQVVNTACSHLLQQLKLSSENTVCGHNVSPDLIVIICTLLYDQALPFQKKFRNLLAAYCPELEVGYLLGLSLSEK